MRRIGRVRAGFASVAIVGAAFAGSGIISASAPPDTEPAGTEPAGSDAPAVPATLSAEAEEQLAGLVAAAEEEGSITVYSSQGLDQLNALAEAFEEQYPGIDVEAVRLTDGDIIPRLETELSTGASGADLAVMAALGWIQTNADAGNFLDPTTSPQIAGLGAYDAAQYVHEGNFFEVGAAVLTLAWNTELVPDGLTDYPDLLDPELAGGRIGVIDPTGGPAIVDFWRWVEENYGEEFLEQLAAQEPMIYPSALPIGEALASGEIYATPYAAPVQLVPSQAAGAPVDFAIGPNGAWGARYFGMILKSAEHPAAAALFADFMLSPLGQELVQGASGSVLPNIPGTLITNDQVRVMDLAGMEPDAVAEYIAKWDELFR
jgi:iron(III) transport system substrate-binding protein